VTGLLGDDIRRSMAVVTRRPLTPDIVRLRNV